MHPAFSVIFFTTASGAGYGLLVLLAVFGVTGVLPTDMWLGFVAFAISLGLIGAGLLSSMLHLGHPERFLKALTQWRTSWLAREGVTASATFAPAGIFAIGWVFFDSASGLFGWMAALAALMGGVTVFFTSMIYASLKPIRQWHNGFVPPAYMVLSAMTGAVLLVLLTRVFAVYVPAFATIAAVFLVLGWIVKLGYWHHIDTSRPRSDLGTATGLNRLGAVRMLELPHTEENFIMREMGFVIARKHARKLRAIVQVALFAVPLALMVLALVVPLGPAAGIGVALIATLSAGIGVVIERWLFFAEATHASLIYYGRTM